MQDMFLERMKQLLKAEYPDFIKALEQPPIKGFYTNPLKSQVLEHLDFNYIEQHPYIKNGYYFDYEQYPLGKHPYFSCGLYYIQEPSAMAVASCVDIKEDDYILDMCAAPGGKSCFIGSQLSNHGLFIANDIQSSRAQILSQNIERFGLQNTIATNCDPIKLTNDFTGFFDKIFLDAPCSGEGMFRKLQQAVDTWSIDKVKECAYIQKQLLDSAYQMLKQDGVIVYSTCTYSLEENEELVAYARDVLHMEVIPIKKQLGMSPGIHMDEVVRLYPHRHKGEGHFIAILKKVEETVSKKMTPLLANITKEQKDLVQAFYKENLTIPVPTYLYNSNNHIYGIQPHFPKINHRILRNGLYLGECKKGRFEPSLALALTLHKEDVKRAYNFNADDKEVSQYLHGETLQGNNQKGYGLILVDGYPLSFYKESNNQVKNLYPKGLRK